MSERPLSDDLLQRVAEVYKIGKSTERGVVYLVECTECDPPAYKIGRSVQHYERLNQLRRQYGRVRLVATIPGGDREGSVHWRFDHLRIRDCPQIGVEWFNDPDGEIRAWFLAQQPAHAAPDDLP